ncbi:hypothetical protein [Streptomyces sp. cg36]|uniref:hypothetical protein n=1 Tax=Streptomyces sp. cg36 TaxID=3238798 RepID=UPI0034E2BBA0
MHVNQAKDHPEPIVSFSLGRGPAGPLSRRQRLVSWCWEHGGRQLHNIRLRLTRRSRA